MRLPGELVAAGRVALALALTVPIPRAMEGRMRATPAARTCTGAVFDLLAPEATWTIVGNAPVSRTYRSRREFMQAVIEPFNARLSRRLVTAVRAIYAGGDVVRDG